MQLFIRPCFIVSVVVLSLFGAFCASGVSSEAITYETLDTWQLEGFDPVGGLVRAGDGNYYGVTRKGGVLNLGTIYRVTPEGDISVFFHVGKGLLSSNGAFGSPSAALVVGMDGALYGVTKSGDFGGGTVFRVTLDGGFSILHRFGTSGDPDGSEPAAPLCVGNDGALYGTTVSGGLSGRGIAFKLTMNGRFTVLHRFAEDGFGSDPAPNGLIFGKDGFLYGSTNRGGSINSGTLFRLSKEGVYLLLKELPFTNDAGPIGELVEGATGIFYGMTEQGGDYHVGCVFSITSEGVLTTLQSFGQGFLSSEKTPTLPRSRLTRAADGRLYGCTSFGGGNNAGVFFRFDPAGTVIPLHEFINTEGNTPIAPLVETSDGAFYSIAGNGPLSSGSIIFKITKDGTPTFLRAFQSGLEFSPSGIVEGDEGVFYGVTSGAGSQFLNGSGANGYGSFFKLIPGQPHEVLHNFDPLDGGYPAGQLVRGNDGNFYGLRAPGGRISGSQFGGHHASIYQLTPGGLYTTLHFFTDEEGNNPLTAMVNGADGALYGVMNNGGSVETDFGSGTGTAFRITTSGAFAVLHDFDLTHGGFPVGGLCPVNANFIGTTLRGGSNDKGVIFSLSTEGVYTVIHEFGGEDGSSPFAAVTPGGDDWLYGIASQGGSGNQGVFFRVKTGGDFSVIRPLHESVANLTLPLTQGVDGSFYGVTGSRVFKMDREGAVSPIHSFDQANDLSEGTGLNAPLVLAKSGALYGTMHLGGVRGGGTVFRLNRASITTQDGVLIDNRTVRLTANANPDGLLSTAYFEYGRSAAYGKSSKPVSIGEGTTPLSIHVDLSDPEPDTLLHFRAVVVRGGIAQYGADHTVLLDLPLNHAPVAVDDTVYLKPGEAVTFDVLANDTDSDGDFLVAGFGTSPGLGTVSFDGINLTYTAGPKFKTSDSFTYTLSDGNGATSTGTVTVLNRFLSGRGAFALVLLADGQPAGTLRLNVTSTGAVSGSIQVGKSRSAIHGSFDFNGEFTQSVNLAGVIVTVTMVSDPIGGRLAGTVEGNNDNFSFSNEAMLAVKAVGNAPAGRYTMVLPAPAPQIVAPRGSGWATIVLGKNGSARFAGRLGDGAAFTASSRLRVDASLWLDAGGALFGTLTFENLPESDFHGSLKWKYLPAMHTEIAAAGARYADVPYFHFSQADALTADLHSVESAAINESIGFGVKGKPFTLNGSTGLSLSINRGTGLFTGKFPKETTRRRSLSGVIFQKKNSGYGIYTESVPGGRGVWQINQAATDSVTLVPR